jgi:hypothetical protein
MPLPLPKGMHILKISNKFLGWGKQKFGIIKVENFY